MLPLQGIRVADLSRLLPGPLATLILSDMGAEVIKIEDPEQGDYMRHVPPFCGDGNGIVFHALNRGKKSISLNLRKSDDKQKFLQFLQTCDILVDSFRPGVLAKLGLPPKELSKQFPRLIICHLTGYGQTASNAHEAGHDLNFISQTGLLHQILPPRLVPAPIADIAGGSWPCATEILAALYLREKTGQGTILDISISHTVQALSWFFHCETQSEKQPRTLSDMLSGKLPCYGIYETKNGYIAVAAVEHQFWNKLIGILGLPHLIGRMHAFGEEGSKIRNELAAIFKQKTTEEWQGELQHSDVCITFLLPNDGELPYPQLASSITLDDKPVALPVIALSDSLRSYKPTAAPLLGEHNNVLLSDDRSI